MKKILYLFLATVFASIIYFQLSDYLSIDNKVIQSLSKYEKASNQIVSSIKEIELLDRKKSHENKYKHGEPPHVILSTNKYYFENTLLKNINYNFDDVLQLWKDEDIVDSSHSIIIYTDTFLVYKVKEYRNVIFDVEHFIVHYPNEMKDEIYNMSAIRTEKIKNNWAYMIKRELRVL